MAGEGVFAGRVRCKLPFKPTHVRSFQVSNASVADSRTATPGDYSLHSCLHSGLLDLCARAPVAADILLLPRPCLTLRAVSASEDQCHFAVRAQHRGPISMDVAGTENIAHSAHSSGIECALETVLTPIPARGIDVVTKRMQ